MPTMTEMNGLWTVQDQLKREAERELRAILNRVNTADPFVVRDTLVEVMPALVAKYGDAAAAVAAEFFESTVGLAAFVPDTAFEAIEAESGASARWAMGAAFQGAPTSASIDMAVLSMSRHILQPGRDTIVESVTRAPELRFARILRGSENCAFCVTMAGRGAVYRDNNVKKFHDGCDCALSPIRDDNDWPAGYDIDKLTGMYEKAREEAGSLSLKGGKPGVTTDLDTDDLSILQVMRKMHNLP